MLLRILLPAVALAAAAPAFAQPVAVTVPYGDLDLTRDAGRQVLEARVARAATKVCGPVEARSLSRMTAWRACVDQARAAARPQLELALDAANARRVAGLSTKLAVLAGL